MNTTSSQDVKYAVFKAARSGGPTLINTADSAAVEGFRSWYGNQDLLVSTWHSEIPDMSAPRKYALCFHIASSNPEAARVSALEALYYVEERFGVPPESMEIIYNGGGGTCSNVVSDDAGTGQNDANGEPDADHAHESVHAGPSDDPGHDDSGGVDRNADHRRTDAEIPCTADGDGPRVNQHSPTLGNAHRVHKSLKDSDSVAEMVIMIPPVVFRGQPTPFMPALNYRLARQMADDGISNIDIDVYVRDSYVALPNSINSATGRFVIYLTPKELLYMDGTRIAELSKQTRPEDSVIQLSRIPEAVEWFSETHDEFGEKKTRQNQLHELMVRNGWEIPPCIRRWLRLCLYDNVRLEVYRITSQFLSWIGASESEIRFQIHSIDRRNPIKDYQKLKNIITFAVENPWFVGCEHALLRQFCPAGGCFMAELIDQHKNPLLFREM